MLTSENKVIQCRNQNMVFRLNAIATEYKSLQMQENMEQKLILSSDFGYVSSIKRSGTFKISSQYFSKILSIQRYLAYRPIPNTSTLH